MEQYGELAIPNRADISRSSLVRRGGRSWMAKQVPAVDGGNLAVCVLIDGEVQNSLCHVLVLARATGRHLFLLAPAFCTLVTFVLIVGLLRGHLTWEDTRCDGVHANFDAGTREFLREKGVEMICSGLRDIILEVMLRRTSDSRDRGDIDDRARMACNALRGGVEEREECDGREEVSASAYQNDGV